MKGKVHKCKRERDRNIAMWIKTKMRWCGPSEHLEHLGNKFVKLLLSHRTNRIIDKASSWIVFVFLTSSLVVSLGHMVVLNNTTSFLFLWVVKRIQISSNMQYCLCETQLRTAFIRYSLQNYAYIQQGFEAFTKNFYPNFHYI